MKRPRLTSGPLLFERFGDFPDQFDFQQTVLECGAHRRNSTQAGALIYPNRRAQPEASVKWRLFEIPENLINALRSGILVKAR
jgi:hypothetical protein